MFILRELTLYIITTVIVFTAVHFALKYFDISISLFSSLSISSLFGVLFFPVLFLAYTINNLLLLDLDFSKEINQTGALGIKFLVAADKESLTEAFKKRKKRYTILQTIEEIDGKQFKIQDDKNKKDQINIKFATADINETEVIITAKDDELETSFSPLKSSRWSSFYKHLFHFHKLFKDFEADYIHSAASEIKSETAMA